MHVENYAESKLILIWGSNSIASNLHFWTFAQQAKRNGAKLICIDPRKTETADKCHQHIALLPGSDGALALGLRERVRQALLDFGVDMDAITELDKQIPELEKKPLIEVPTLTIEALGRVRTVNKNSLVILNRLFYSAQYLPYLFHASVCLDYRFYLSKNERKKLAYAKCLAHQCRRSFL